MEWNFAYMGTLFDGQMRSTDRGKVYVQEKHQHENIKLKPIRTQEVNSIILSFKT